MYKVEEVKQCFRGFTLDWKKKVKYVIYGGNLPHPEYICCEREFEDSLLPAAVAAFQKAILDSPKIQWDEYGHKSGNYFHICLWRLDWSLEICEALGQDKTLLEDKSVLIASYST